MFWSSKNHVKFIIMFAGARTVSKGRAGREWSALCRQPGLHRYVFLSLLKPHPVCKEFFFLCVDSSWFIQKSQIRITIEETNVMQVFEHISWHDSRLKMVSDHRNQRFILHVGAYTVTFRQSTDIPHITNALRLVGVRQLTHVTFIWTFSCPQSYSSEKQSYTSQGGISMTSLYPRSWHIPKSEGRKHDGWMCVLQHLLCCEKPETRYPLRFVSSSNESPN